MEKEMILEKNMCDYSKQVEILQVILICIGALLVPTFLAKILVEIFGLNSFVATYSQIIVGSIVNISLIIAAINLKGWKKIIGIITLPSISTILGGYVFQTASTYMLFMIPAIWLGNFSLVYIYKLLLLKRKQSYFVTGIAAVIVKVGIIFLGFNLLNIFNIFPEKLIQTLQTAMGSTQMITATIGMLACYIVYVKNKKLNGN